MDPITVRDSHFDAVREKIAEGLYSASGCTDWPFHCTDLEGCGALIALLPHVGLGLDSTGEIRFATPGISTIGQEHVLGVVSTMTRYGNLTKPHIFEGYLEIPKEIGVLLDKNDGEWREALRLNFLDATDLPPRHTVVQFVSELLAIAIPDEYLNQLSIDLAESVGSSHITASTGMLSVEERLLLLDHLWIPDWSLTLPKLTRRVIALIIAAIDGRPYATPFVQFHGNFNEIMVTFPICIEEALGVSERDAEKALKQTIEGTIQIFANKGIPAPFDFNT